MIEDRCTADRNCLNILKTNANLIVSFVILTIYMLPFYIRGADSHTLIHDNLDANVVWFKILAESGHIFGSFDAAIPNIMNGLPRNCLGSEFNLILWLYYFFDSIDAYILNLTFMHLIAFIGMYLLLKRHFLRERESEFIVTGTALCFSLLPFWPSGGLSVAGLPLALYAFLNIREHRAKCRDWIILLLIPFYSSFVLSYIFFLFGMILIWIYDANKLKRTNYQFFAAIAFMTLIFVIVEYRLIFDMFLNSEYISNRVEFDSTYRSTDFLSSIYLSMYNFVFGQYHAASLHTYFVGIAIGIACLKLFNEGKLLKNDILILLIMISLVISIFYGFWSWEGILPLKKQISILNTFTFYRFNWLHPLLWYICFALSIHIIFRYFRRGKQIAVALIILQAAFLFSYSSDSVQSGGFGQVYDESLSFKEFYSEEIFQDIITHIGKPQSEYRIVSIGLHPSIAQYNGFYTLDSYQANYPLEYKHEFRRIIKDELDKNEDARIYFDTWGCRCYVFSAEIFSLGEINTKDKQVNIRHLKLNTTALKNMGGLYVLSAVEILNYEDNNLELLRTFESDASPWKIRLYMIK
ncbi:MAG TPA: DUF6044 family protein [Methanothrix sp.]|nr:DUF6044 family protein [Methanothrix sp.]